MAVVMIKASLLSGIFLLSLSACQMHPGDMKANTMRAAIDNCKENQLGVLLFQRADRSIVAIRCMPMKEEIAHTVTLRKRLPLQLMKLLSEQIDIIDKN